MLGIGTTNGKEPLQFLDTEHLRTANRSIHTRQNQPKLIHGPPQHPRIKCAHRADRLVERASRQLLIVGQVEYIVLQLVVG